MPVLLFNVRSEDHRHVFSEKRVLLAWLRDR